MQWDQGEGRRLRECLSQTRRQQDDMIGIGKEQGCGSEIWRPHRNSLRWVTESRENIIALQPTSYRIQQHNLGVSGRLAWMQAAVFSQAIEDRMTLADKAGVSFLEESS